MQKIEDLFKELKTKDPKIIISNDTICLSPFYWNYSLVSTFVPIFVPIYILIRQNDEMINFFCILISIASIIVLITQLRYYNTVMISFSEKTISVIPNSVTKFLHKKNIILFNDVRKFEVDSNINADGFKLLNRRYIIILVLKKSEKIKLLSSDELSNAELIAKNLSSLVFG